MAKRICPRCGSRDMASILWDYPAMSLELMEAVDTGKVVLGGCCTPMPTPTHRCNACEKEFGGGYFIDPVFIHKFEFIIGGHFGPTYRVSVDPRRHGVTEIARNSRRCRRGDPMVR